MSPQKMSGEEGAVGGQETKERELRRVNGVRNGVLSEQFSRGVKSEGQIRGERG